MGKKKVKVAPIPFRLTEAETKRHCITTNNVALLNAVLDRRHELYKGVKLRLWIDGYVWTEAVPHVMKHQLERRKT